MTKSLTSIVEESKGKLDEPHVILVVKSLLKKCTKLGNSGLSLSPEYISIGPGWEAMVVGEEGEEQGPPKGETGLGFAKEESYMFQVGLLGLLLLYGKSIFPRSDQRKFLGTIQEVGFLPHPEEVEEHRVKNQPKTRRRFSAPLNTVLLGLLCRNADSELLHAFKYQPE